MEQTLSEATEKVLNGEEGNKKVITMSDVENTSYLKISPNLSPFQRETVLDIRDKELLNSEKLQYARQAVPDYESSTSLKVAEGFTGFFKSLPKIPEQIQIAYGEGEMILGGITGNQETVKRGKSLVQSAISEIDYKNRFVEETSVQLSEKDKGSLSYAIGSGAGSLTLMLGAGYLGGPALAIGTGATLEVGSEFEEGVNVYRQKTGDIELKNIDSKFAGKEVAGGIALGVANSILEKIGGAPKLISLTKQPLKTVGKNILVGGLSEGTTEFSQSLTNLGIDLVDGTIDFSQMPDSLKNAFMEGAVGGILGSAVGGVGALTHKARAKSILKEQLKNTVPSNDLERVVDTVWESANDTVQSIVSSELVVSEELRNKHGDVFNSFVNASLKAMQESGGYQGVSEDELAQYATETAKGFADQVLAEANLRGVLIDDVIKASEIVYENGELRLAQKKQAQTPEQLELFQTLPAEAYDAQGKADINTPEFKNWFGDSKILDEDGQPLVVYHGTSAEFDSFDKGKIKIDNLGRGFYFTDNKAIADSYAKRRTEERGGSEKVVPAYLSAKKIFDLENISESEILSFLEYDFMKSGLSKKEAKQNSLDLISDEDIIENGKPKYSYLIDTSEQNFQDWAKIQGYDALSILGKDKRTGLSGKAIVVFEPNQIKSVYNRGTFSPESDNIYEQSVYNKSSKKGSFDTSTKVIKLFEDADFSTLPHELAHFWLDNMSTYARSGNASEAYLARFNAVKQYLGMDDGPPTRRQQEKFASAYEKYIYRGEFPNALVQGAFDDYERWIRRVYNSISDIRSPYSKNIKLTPDIIKFFDSMISGGIDVSGANAQMIEQEKKEKAKITVSESETKTKDSIKEESDAIEENIITDRELTNKINNPVQTGNRTGYLTAYNRMTGENVEAGSVSLEDNYKKAQDFVYKNPDIAQDIVYGRRDEPEGILKNLIYLAYNEQQKAIGNTQNRARVAMNQALELRRAGQEIVSQRIAYGNSSLEKYTAPVWWMNKILASRISSLADKNRMSVFDLEDLIKTRIQEGISNGKTAEQISKGLSEELGTELYQQDIEIEPTYDTKNKAYNYVYNYVNSRLGLSKLSIDDATKITNMADDLYANIENVSDGNGNPDISFFKKLHDLEAFANSLSPSTEWRILSEVIAPGNLLASIKTPLFNVIANIPGGLLNYVNRRARIGVYKSIISNPTEKYQSYIRNSWNIFKSSGYNISTFTPETVERSILGEKITHTEGESTTKIGKTIRWWGRLYEKYVYKYGLGSGDIIFKDMAFLDSVSLQATKEAKGNVSVADSIFEDALRVEPKTEIGRSIRSIAQQDALIATYQNDSTISRSSLMVRNAFDKIAPGLGKFLMPFVKTPANVIGFSIQTTFPVKQIYDSITSSIKAGKVVIPESSRGVLAQSGVAYLISSIIAFGLLDDDDYMPPYVFATNADKTLARELNIPYNSIKWGDTWVSLDIFGPLASVLSGMLQAKRTEGTLNKISQFTSSAGSQLLSLPVLGGVSTITENASQIIQKVRAKKDLDVIKDVGEKAINAIYSRALPAILRDVSKLLDPKEKDERGIKEILETIPFVRNTLRDKTNLITGVVEEKDFIDRVLPLFFGSRVKQQIVNPVAEELIRLNTSGYGVSLADPTWRGDLSLLDEDTRVRALSDFASLFSEKLSKLINQNSYQKSSDEDKAEKIKKLRSSVIKSIKLKYRKSIRASKNMEK